MKKILLLISVLLTLPIFVSGEEDVRLQKVKNPEENSLARQAMAKILLKDKAPDLGPVFESILKNKKEDPKMRIISARAMGELLYNTAAPLLMSTIKDTEEPVDLRQSCMDSLGVFADKKTFVEVGTGIVNFDDESNRISLSYLEAFEKSKFRKDKDILLLLAQFLGASFNIDVKKKAIAELSESNDKQTLTILMISLSDRIAGVRKVALKSLTKMGGSSMVPLFISRLEDEKNEEIKGLLLDELLKLQIPKLKSIWLEELEKRVEEEKKGQIKAKIAKVLERVKKAQAGSDSGATGQKTFTAPVKTVTAEGEAPAAK